MNPPSLADLPNRYKFLAALHDLLDPAVYLEIGVQYGWSLKLAKAPLTIGVDPAPMLDAPLPDAQLYEMTSQRFFAEYAEHVGETVDLAFIDGMHHYEDALRDFIGVEQMAHPGAVTVFDDVLPYTQEMAARKPCPGDWTGDVWKVEPILRYHRPDLHLTLVDTQPTGLLLVRNLDPENRRLADRYDVILHHWPPADDPVPEEVIGRQAAVSPGEALESLRDWRDRPQ